MQCYDFSRKASSSKCRNAPSFAARIRFFTSRSEIKRMRVRNLLCLSKYISKRKTFRENKKLNNPQRGDNDFFYFTSNLLSVKN